MKRLKIMFQSPRPAEETDLSGKLIFKILGTDHIVCKPQVDGGASVPRAGHDTVREAQWEESPLCCLPRPRQWLLLQVLREGTLLPSCQAAAPLSGQGQAGRPSPTALVHIVPRCPRWGVGMFAKPHSCAACRVTVSCCP